MDPNPYAPPAAVVADIVAPSDVKEEPPLYAVSCRKLFVMFMCTFGFYGIFWFAQQWKAIQQHEGRLLSPYLRAILAPIYCFPCFWRIRGYEAGISRSRLWAIPLAITYVVAIFMSGLPDPYGVLFYYLSSLPLVAVQEHVNRINAVSTPSHDRNDRFSAGIGWRSPWAASACSPSS